MAMPTMTREVKHAIRHRPVTLIQLCDVNGRKFVQPTRTYTNGVVTLEFPPRPYCR